MTSSLNKTQNPWTVHSTFRDEVGGQVKPHGLEWHMGGDSILYYAPVSPDAKEIIATKGLDNDETRQWLVEAHNRWCFAKDETFKKVQDIEEVQWTPDGNHVEIFWREPELLTQPEQKFTIAQVSGLVRMDASAKGEEPPCQVWINGYFAGVLQPNTVDSIVEQVDRIPSKKLVFRKSRGIIRIERRFKGMIRGQEVYEHCLDNLYALEDPQIVDNNTIIGTATLPDWIMGGELTSRIWVSELENGSILCKRPLYRDDVGTSDRTYWMKKGKDDDKIAVFKEEMARIRYLATLEHPFEALRPSDFIVPIDEEKKEPTGREIQHKRSSRKFFGL
ncbi:expressed unknown protein [Seminavis robusta]|uniref:Uncharacterized protein n=1 Tax=Seminavis robusta TaxID=568900 RepID=A0A9N8DQJ4_9STRA|nr:expressed unknown protein [Seminavis robusta]|eukprot:Sro280_g107130.1 n/a (333) ;mRNA; f:68031-69029